MADKKGTLTQNGVHLKDHEYETVKFFLERGCDVELIPPLQIKNAHTPDVLIRGIFWEIKAPTGNGKNTFKNTLRNASRQSDSIIIDLRRCKMDDKKALNEIARFFWYSKRIRHIKIILKTEEMLDLSK